MNKYNRYLTNDLSRFILPLVKDMAFIKGYELVKVSVKNPIMKSVSNTQKIFEIQEFISTRCALLEIMRLKEMGVNHITMSFAENYQRKPLVIPISDLDFNLDELITPEVIQSIWSKNYIYHNFDSVKIQRPNCFFFEVISENKNFMLKESGLRSLLTFVSDNFNKLLGADVSNELILNYFPLELIDVSFYRNLMREQSLVDKVVKNWGAEAFNRMIIESMAPNSSCSVVEYPSFKELKTYSEETNVKLKNWEEFHFFNILDSLIRERNHEEMIDLKLSLYRESDIKENQAAIFRKSFNRHPRSELVSAFEKMKRQNHQLAKDAWGSFKSVVLNEKYYDKSSFSDNELDVKRAIFYQKKLPIMKIYEEQLPGLNIDWSELSRISYSNNVVTHKNIKDFYPLASSLLITQVMECFHLVAMTLQMSFFPSLNKELKTAVTLKNGGVYFQLYLPEDFDFSNFESIFPLVISKISSQNLMNMDLFLSLSEKWLIDYNLLKSGSCSSESIEIVDFKL